MRPPLPISRYNLLRKKPEQTEENEIKLKAQARAYRYAVYAAKILYEGKHETVNMHATGPATVKVIQAVEFLRKRVKGLHSAYEISTTEFNDEYHPIERGLDVVTIKRLIPTLQAQLSLQAKDAILKSVGYMPPLPDKEVLDEEEFKSKVQEHFNRDREGPEGEREQRPDSRWRGRGYGERGERGGRGRRGGSRGQRGGRGAPGFRPQGGHSPYAREDDSPEGFADREDRRPPRHPRGGRSRSYGNRPDRDDDRRPRFDDQQDEGYGSRQRGSRFRGEGRERGGRGYDARYQNQRPANYQGRGIRGEERDERPPYQGFTRGREYRGYTSGGRREGGYAQGGGRREGGYDQGGRREGGYDQGGRREGGYDQSGERREGGYGRGGERREDGYGGDERPPRDGYQPQFRGRGYGRGRGQGGYRPQPPRYE